MIEYGSGTDVPLLFLTGLSHLNLQSVRYLSYRYKMRILLRIHQYLNEELS